LTLSFLDLICRSSKMSTILEFHIGDIQLETCMFGVWIPTYERARPKTYTISSPTKQVEVWLLDSSSILESEIQAGTMSWTTKPPRTAFLGNLSINPGGPSTVIDGYYCKTGSIQLIEVVCVGDGDCIIDFTQDTTYPKIGPLSGIYQDFETHHAMIRISNENS